MPTFSPSVISEKWTRSSNKGRQKTAKVEEALAMLRNSAARVSGKRDSKVMLNPKTKNYNMHSRSIGAVTQTEVSDEGTVVAKDIMEGLVNTAGTIDGTGLEMEDVALATGIGVGHAISITERGPDQEVLDIRKHAIDIVPDRVRGEASMLLTMSHCKQRSKVTRKVYALA